MSWYKKSQYNQYSLPLDFEDKTDSPLFDDLTSEKEMSWFNPQTRQYKKGPKKDYFKEVKGCQIPRAKATGLVALGRGSNSNVRRKS